jgi:hypothetical protein
MMEVNSPIPIFLTSTRNCFSKNLPLYFSHNGLAETKLQHILETGLTHLAHAHLSNKYWVDSFLTALYIINRLPTATLKHISSYEKLYNKSPNYSRFRVFVCLCYPLLWPYSHLKLEYQSKPFIFLGYQYASYKCFDLVTNKAYLSRHVIFDEASFPAKDPAITPLPSQLAANGEFTLPFSLLFSPLPVIATKLLTPVSSVPNATTSLLASPNTNTISAHVIPS